MLAITAVATACSGYQALWTGHQAELYGVARDEAARLNEQATEAFDKGDQARKHADNCVQVTVMLATVLLLMALSQRFKVHPVRVGLGVMAALLLCLPLYRILTLPRA